MNDLKETLKLAKEMVLDPDLGLPEQLQAAAFREVFRVLTGAVAFQNMERAAVHTLPQPGRTLVDQDVFFKNLSEKSTIEESKLKLIYDYSENEVSLILHPIPGAGKMEQEKNAARLVLFGYRIGLKQDWVSSRILRQALQNVGLGGTNFSTNVRSLKPEVLSAIQNKESGYKLTVPGEQQTIQLLREITTESQIDNE